MTADDRARCATGARTAAASTATTTPALGHTRLAIIDTDGRRAAAVQRGRDRRGSLQRRDLQLRRAAATSCAAAATASAPRSDTEVVVHAWEEWGEQCFAPLQRPVGARPVGPPRAAAGALARPPRRAPALLHRVTRHRIVFASRGQGAVRPTRPCRAPSTRSASTRCSPTGRRWRRARCSRGVEQLEPGHVAVLRPRRLPAPRPTGASTSPTGRRAGARTRRRTPPSCASALVEAARLRFAAQRRAGGRLPLRRHRLLDHRRGDRARTPRRRCTPSRCASPTRSTTKAVHQQQMVAAARHAAPGHRRLARRRRRGVPRGGACTPRRPIAAHRARAAVPALAAGARQRLQGRA